MRGKDIVRMRRSVEGIRNILTDSGKLIVLSSGGSKCNHAAGILVENSWIADHSTGSDFAQTPASLKSALEDSTATVSDIAAQIKPYASKIASETGVAEHTGLVIVAEQALVEGLSQREDIEFDGSVNLGPLAMNHFSIDLISG